MSTGLVALVEYFTHYHSLICLTEDAPLSLIPRKKFYVPISKFNKPETPLLKSTQSIMNSDCGLLHVCIKTLSRMSPYVSTSAQYNITFH